jgi:predicted small secreted protein
VTTLIWVLLHLLSATSQISMTGFGQDIKVLTSAFATQALMNQETDYDLKGPERQ